MEFVSWHMAEPHVTTGPRIECGTTVQDSMVVDQHRIAGVDSNLGDEFGADHAAVELSYRAVELVHVFGGNVERSKGAVEVPHAAGLAEFVERDQRAAMTKIDLTGVAPDVADQKRCECVVGIGLFVLD